MKIGDHAQITREFSEEDLREYEELSRHTPRFQTIPEPLVGALFSYLLGVRLPGAGTNYLKQETRFHNTARVGDNLTARVEITRIRAEKHLVDLATLCKDSGGRLIASGRALVFVCDLAGSPGRDD